MITEAVIRRAGFEKCIGLCNGPVTVMKEEPEMLGGKQEDYTWRFAGLNHFHYHRVWDRNGNEVTSEVLRKMAADDKTNMANVHDENYIADHLQAMNCIPFSYHRYYYMYEDMLAHQLEDYRKGATRAETVKKVEDELFELYRDPALHEMPELLKKRGGAYYSDAACETIHNIFNDTGNLMVVNTENRGAVSCLPYDSIAEVSSLINAKGASPLVWGDFEPSERGWLQIMKAMEECVIEAAVSGDYGMLVKAFQINPLIRHGRASAEMLKEMLAANEKYLPQFKEKIQELKAEGIVIHDEKVRELCEQSL
jgi:6-phospho-beta-glucosidase